MDYNHAVGKEKERQNKSRANLEKILYRSVREESSMPYKKVFINIRGVKSINISILHWRWQTTPFQDI